MNAIKLCNHIHMTYPNLICFLPYRHEGLHLCSPIQPPKEVVLTKNPDHYQAGAFCEHDNDMGIVCSDCVKVVPKAPGVNPKRDTEGFRLTAKGQRVRLPSGKYAR